MPNTTSDSNPPLPDYTGIHPSALKTAPKKKRTIFDWLEDGSRGIGKKVDKSSVARGVYGGLDGWSSSYSMVKYSFDLFYTTSSISSSDIMHNWMLTPEGIATVATWSAFVIGLSILGNVYEKDDEEKFKQNIAHFQSYFRVVMKGLKNSYKGIRSTLQAASMLSDVDLRALMVPLGLVLGIISVANRLWYQRMVDLRKATQKLNKDFLKEFKRSRSLGNETLEKLEARLKEQNKTNSLALLSAFQSGLTDGLYLFMGSLAIASLCPPILITVLVFSALFSLLTIINRMYEEKMFQDKLTASQEDIKLAVCGQELEKNLIALMNVFQHLASLTKEDEEYAEAEAKYNELHRNVIAIHPKFDLIHEKLKKLHLSTYRSAILTGLRHGLYAYSALTSVLFGIATICTIAAAPVSPFIVLAFAVAGMVCLIGFLAHALWEHSQRPPEPKDSGNEKTFSNKKLLDLLDKMKEDRNNQDQQQGIREDDIKEAVTNGMLVDPSPRYLFQEAFEVARSFASGLTKAQKSVDYTLNPLQELDDKGHPHDTPEMLWVTAGVSLVFAVGLGLKACAKGFGKDQEKGDGFQPGAELATDPELEPRVNPERESTQQDVSGGTRTEKLTESTSNPDLNFLVHTNRNPLAISSLTDSESPPGTPLSSNPTTFFGPASRRPSETRRRTSIAATNSAANTTGDLTRDRCTF
jgi:hypothetical protein